MSEASEVGGEVRRKKKELRTQCSYRKASAISPRPRSSSSGLLFSVIRRNPCMASTGGFRLRNVSFHDSFSRSIVWYCTPGYTYSSHRHTLVSFTGFYCPIACPHARGPNYPTPVGIHRRQGLIGGGARNPVKVLGDESCSSTGGKWIG